MRALSNQFKNILSGLLFLSAFLLAFCKVSLPMWQQEQQLMDQIANTYQELKRLEERPEYTTETDEYLLPAPLSTMMLLSYFDDITHLYAVNLIEVGFGAVQEMHDLRGYTVLLQLRGSFSALSQFLTHFEDTEYLVQIQRWQYQQDSFSGNLTLRLELVFWGQDVEYLENFDAQQKAAENNNRENPFTAP